MHRSNPTRIFPQARRFMATTPTGRPNPVNANLAATDSNLARQPPAGYGGAPGPIPQAGPGMHRGGAPPPPPPPPPKGGSSMPLLLGIGALAAGGAYYYLTQTSDGSVHIKSNAEKLQDRAEDKFDSLKERAAAEASSLKHRAENLADKAESRYLDPAKREAGRFVDKLQSPDDKYGAEQVKDAAQGSRSPFAALNPTNLGDKLKREAKDVAGDARDEARSWGDALRSGPSEYKAWKPTVDEIKRYRDMLRSPDRKFGYDQVADAFRNHGVETATVASRNPWFDWMGPGHDLHLRSAERQLDTWEREGKSAIDNAATAVKSSYQDAKAETKSWLNWGAQKAENAADAAETELERTKRAAEREASSWSNWASRKTDEAKSAVSDAASSAEASAKSTYNDAASAAEQAKRDTEREAKSWWNWSGEKAHEGKESLKDGLLAAERGVEHGAQKAQYETKKL